eukprot:gene191-3979_t
MGLTELTARSPHGRGPTAAEVESHLHKMTPVDESPDDEVDDKKRPSQSRSICECLANAWDAFDRWGAAFCGLDESKYRQFGMHCHALNLDAVDALDLDALVLSGLYTYKQEEEAVMEGLGNNEVSARDARLEAGSPVQHSPDWVRLSVPVTAPCSGRVYIEAARLPSK